MALFESTLGAWLTLGAYALLLAAGIRRLVGSALGGANPYWRDNITLVVDCLMVWFVISFGFGILLVEPLNSIRVGGFKLGFWFAQQGSIYVFLGIIFFYAWRMNRLDRRHGVDERDEDGDGA